MYKLLIVDDEPTIRKGLSQFIPWSSLDAVVSGEAANGKEAMALIESLHPDIVITDIRMPVMDGIAVARYLHEHFPQIKCIILTGYAEFEYAQSAIRYGVVDFVLKPTSREKLIQAVRLAQERIRSSGDSELERALLREHLLQQLTRGVEPENAIRRLNGAGLKPAGFYLAAFQLSEYQPKKKESNFQSLKNMVSMQISQGACYRYDGDILLTLIPMGRPSAQAVSEPCREICDAVNNFSNTKVSAGVSAFHDALSELPAAALEAVEALAQHFYDDSELCFYRGPADRQFVTYTPFLCGLEAHLESYDFDAAREDLNAFLSGLRSRFTESREAIETGVQVYLLCARVLSKSGREPLSEGMETVTACTSISRLETVLRAILAQAEEKLRVRAKHTSTAVTQALEYIDAHLAGDLRLDIIAGAVHLNPHHLCRVFKKETGETLGDYITRTRVEYAKTLLADPDIRAYEVAELAGFNDPAYFSSTFKKVTGLSPREFQSGNAGHTK